MSNCAEDPKGETGLAFDFKKDRTDPYAPKTAPALIDVPAMFAPVPLVRRLRRRTTFAPPRRFR